jgi:hypothetical protein
MRQRAKRRCIKQVFTGLQFFRVLKYLAEMSANSYSPALPLDDIFFLLENDPAQQLGDRSSQFWVSINLARRPAGSLMQGNLQVGGE